MDATKSCAIAVVFLAIFTVSHPEIDTVIPETTNFGALAVPTSMLLEKLNMQHREPKHLVDPKEAAETKIKLLAEQGVGNDECKRLADKTTQGMTSSLEAEQGAMDALSDGSDCLVDIPTRRLLSVSDRQQRLNEAHTRLTEAKEDLTTKNDMLEAKQEAPVTFTLNFNTIGDDLASIGALVKVAAAFTQVKAEVAVAEKAAKVASIAVAAAQAAFDAILTDSQDASQKCLCDAKAAHGLAWANAQKVVADNTAGWKVAHHMKCALDSNPEDTCSVPAFAVTDKPLITEASTADCAASEGSAPDADGWMDAIVITSDDPALHYNSPSWRTPNNDAIKSVYMTQKVNEVRFTMNGQTRVFKMKATDKGRFTLQQLFSEEKNILTEDSWDAGIYQNLPFVQGYQDPLEKKVCKKSMGFNIKLHASGSRTRFGVQMDEGCSGSYHPGGAFGIGLYVGDWYEKTGNGCQGWNSGNCIHDQLASGMQNCCRTEDKFLASKLEVR